MSYVYWSQILLATLNVFLQKIHELFPKMYFGFQNLSWEREGHIQMADCLDKWQLSETFTTNHCQFSETF